MYGIASTVIICFSEIWKVFNLSKQIQVIVKGVYGYKKSELSIQSNCLRVLKIHVFQLNAVKKLTNEKNKL